MFLPLLKMSSWVEERDLVTWKEKLEVTRNPAGSDTGKPWLGFKPISHRGRIGDVILQISLPFGMFQSSFVSATFNPSLGAELKMLPLKSPAWFCPSNTLFPKDIHPISHRLPALTRDVTQETQPFLHPCFCTSPPAPTLCGFAASSTWKIQSTADPLGFLWRAQKLGLNKGVRQQADALC